jgi:hypothetical protein
MNVQKESVLLDWRPAIRSVLGLLAVALLAAPATAHEDSYLRYIRTAPEFQAVRQDPKLLIGRWNTWIYMPWRYQWTVGTGDEGGRFCREYGFNGGFTDHGEGPLAWLETWRLRFYNDHTADKGYLYLHGANSKANFAKYQRNARAIRSGADGPRPLDDAMLQKLRGIVTRNVDNLKKSPMRIAYALDDEISWGAFVTPLPWRISDDDAAYESWLKTYYGGHSPKPEYVTPEFTQAQLGRPLAQLDFSPLLDRITYNDSVWANLIGKLVECANQADPDTPCGFVGGQCPNLWGGYDYAKLTKKIQFIEAYNLGSSQAILRSLSPHGAMPQVTTHFHSPERGIANDVWQSWYYFAHGSRGMIGWVEGWFDGGKPRPWLAEYRSTLKELGQMQGPKMVGSQWIHDGVAIYYSHPSIQVSWCLDIQPHGKTWVNRGSDDRLGTSHNVRRAWEYLLTDSGIQYDFLAYDRVVIEGVPEQYKVLILPACYALSDIEAQRIREFCRRGGTVIADFAPGLFDQHGKGRARGALDDLFGVRHDGGETSKDFFAGRLWVETDQDAGFSYKKYADLFATLKCPLRQGFAVAERRLPPGGSTRGRAVYLNLSPQRYLQYREEGTATDAHRRVFLDAVTAAGVRPRIQVTSGGRRPQRCEATYWTKDGRTLVFVVQNAAVSGSSQGGGGADGLARRTIPIEVEFPTEVHGVVDERSGKSLSDGRKFAFQFKPAEAVFFSFQAGSAR